MGRRLVTTTISLGLTLALFIPCMVAISNEVELAEELTAREREYESKLAKKVSEQLDIDISNLNIVKIGASVQDGKHYMLLKTESVVNIDSGFRNTNVVLEITEENFNKLEKCLNEENKPLQLEEADDYFIYKYNMELLDILEQVTFDQSSTVYAILDTQNGTAIYPITPSLNLIGGSEPESK